MHTICYSSSNKVFRREEAYQEKKWETVTVRRQKKDPGGEQMELAGTVVQEECINRR